MVQAGLVAKASSAHGRRRVELTLTWKAEVLLRQLTAAHLDELENLGPVLTRVLTNIAERHGDTRQTGEV